MSKFKVPPHPIYRNGYAPHTALLLQLPKDERYIQMSEGVKEAYQAIHTKPELAHLRNEAQDEGFYHFRGYTETVQRCEVADSGHQLIRVQSEQWNESISMKTLKNLNAEDIKLPWEAFSIDLSNCDWAGKYDVCTVSHFGSQMVLRLEDSKDEWFIILLAHNISIGSTMEQTRHFSEIQNGVEITSQDITYKLLSIIMYTTTFRREPNRVDIRSVKARSPQGVPKYRMNIVNLTQPEYALTGKRGGRKSDNKTQLHIVRGFWRSQPYGKRELKQTKIKWIAPFWRGQGKEHQMKVTKI